MSPKYYLDSVDKSKLSGSILSQASKFFNSLAPKGIKMMMMHEHQGKLDIVKLLLEFG